MIHCISYEASMRAKQCLCFNKNIIKGENLGPDCCRFHGGGFVVINSLVYVAPLVCEGSVFGLCFLMH